MLKNVIISVLALSIVLSVAYLYQKIKYINETRREIMQYEELVTKLNHELKSKEDTIALTRKLVNLQTENLMLCQKEKFELQLKANNK